MKALPGLLIEYLITGAVALFWLLPLFSVEHNAIDPITALILLPSLYVIGMAIDALVFLLSRGPKHILRRIIDRKHNIQISSRTARHAFIIMKSPEVAEELEKRSSRDRIARGTILNVALISLIQEFTLIESIGSILLSVCMWLWFEWQSYSFETQASKLLGYTENKNT